MVTIQVILHGIYPKSGGVGRSRGGGGGHESAFTTN